MGKSSTGSVFPSLNSETPEVRKQTSWPRFLHSAVTPNIEKGSWEMASCVFVIILGHHFIVRNIPLLFYLFCFTYLFIYLEEKNKDSE